MPSRLDKGLLFKIMQRVSEVSDETPSFADTTDFLDLIGKERGNPEDMKDMIYIDRHLVFLEECGLVSLGTPTYSSKRTIQLTAPGRMFIQPELAEFGNSSLLPDIIESLEDRIKTLTYPEEEKNGLLFQIRDAVSKNKGDLILKTIIEIASRITKS